jgi:uncharacterized protein
VWLTPMMSDDLTRFGGGELSRRLIHGGLPPFFLADHVREDEIQEWMDAYWAKDIQELFRIERRSAFLRFVELVLAQSGGIFEATKFAAPCEVSRPTITNYLAVLEATKLAHVIRPYSPKRRNEVVSAPKVYGFDTGFVVFYRGWTSVHPRDLGQLWEHYVLNELHSRASAVQVRYWRNVRQQELDFVLLKRGRDPVAVECKWLASGDEDLSGLAAFRAAYPSGENYVVTSDVSAPFTRSVRGVEVEYVSLEELITRLTPA